VNPELKKLVELQEVDLVLDRIRSEIDQIPKEIERLKKELEESQNLVEDLKKRLIELQIERKNKELELKAKEEELKKHQTELYMVKTNEAYTALLKEIEEGKKLKSDIEDAVLALLEQEDDLSGQEKIRKEDLAQKKEEVEKQQKELEERLVRLNENLLEVESEEKQKIAGIESRIFERYQKIREKKDGLAVVPIIDGFCGGCNIAVPPELINDVLRAKELVACTNCLRILYLKNLKEEK